MRKRFFPSPVDSSNICNGWDLAGAEARNLIQILQVGSQDSITWTVAFQSVPYQKAGLEKQSWETNPGIPVSDTGILTTRLNTHSLFI